VTDNALVPKTDRHCLKAGGNSEQDQAKTLADKARTLAEKKTVVNLLEAYAVAVKHYLRREEGIGYEDLKPLVPFLSSYNHPFPATTPSVDDHTRMLQRRLTHDRSHNTPSSSVPTTQAPASPNHLLAVPGASSRPPIRTFWTGSTIAPPYDQEALRPAESGPEYCWRKAFPFPFIIWVWKKLKKLCKLGANDANPKFCPKKDNIPLEISLYLVCISHHARRILRSHFRASKTSYLCKLQTCGAVDDPTLGMFCWARYLRH
jgi:hypothetical protein